MEFLRTISDSNYKTETDHSLEDLNRYRGLPFSMDEMESQFFCLCQTLSLEAIELVHRDFLRQNEMNNNQTEENIEESNSYRSTLNDEDNDDNSREYLNSSKSHRKPNSKTEEHKSDNSVGERKKSSLDIGPGITLTKRHSGEIHLCGSHDKKLNHHKGNLYKRIDEEEDEDDMKKNACEHLEELPPLAEFNKYLSLNLKFEEKNNKNKEDSFDEDLPSLNLK